jgi:hypothetical protein
MRIKELEGDLHAQRSLYLELGGLWEKCGERNHPLKTKVDEFKEDAARMTGIMNQHESIQSQNYQAYKEYRLQAGARSASQSRDIRILSTRLDEQRRLSAQISKNRDELYSKHEILTAEEERLRGRLVGQEAESVRWMKNCGNAIEQRNDAHA